MSKKHPKNTETPDLKEGTRVIVNGKLRGEIRDIVNDSQPIYFVRLDGEKQDLDEPFGRKALQPLSLLDLLAEQASDDPPEPPDQRDR